MRVATLALSTFTVLWGSRSSGVVIAKFSGHAATFRSSPTVFADTLVSGSISTRMYKRSLAIREKPCENCGQKLANLFETRAEMMGWIAWLNEPEKPSGQSGKVVHLKKRH